ncbi:Hypothetical protein HVIM_04097 (plasmid) [Roseomonas mucosa]|nr:MULTISPECIES: DUF3237 domain-containing protein [Roseomonas]MBS5903884.1 DUF3237 domain-containing protein [Acetobacteraceae bacterium]AWV20740.1 Hypothetical protein RADP37_04097 [Roseomonas mucosa]MCG7350520.1 DUF3237 domain-containing protein [Roseomonas mucosa]MCG7355796.1 DUF3237 domain-containing protein [Roseomonas mucosa]MDT8278223.1 DUF3237 domain-containing protein [Roseomonas mucosa]
MQDPIPGHENPAHETKRATVLRRNLLLTALAGGGMAAALPGAEARAEDYVSLAPQIPMAPPRTEFIYEAICDLSPTLALGNSPLGERRMVPITGGEFRGPRLRGKVLPGGADRQLVRRDGVRQLNALYELQTEDGAVITVNNHVTVDNPPGGPRYAFSVLDITAPEGPHGWLNKGVYVGTLDSLRPARTAVLIRVFRLA